VKTKKVSVFKNGTAYFLKSGEVQTKNKKAEISEVGKALFGTLWVFSENGKITSINNSTENVTEKKDIVSTFDLLNANIGKHALITFYDNKEVKAKIIEIKGEIVVLNTDDGAWLTVPSKEIRKLVFNGEKPSLKYDVKTDRSKIILNFKKDGSKKVNLSYLQKGIGWLPNYLIKILNDNQVQITLNSVLINDAEDIENSEIDFIVGVPNFKYSNVYSPLTSKEDINKFLLSLNGGSSYGYYNNFDNNNSAIMTQSLSNSYSSNRRRGYEQSSVSYNPNSFSGLDGASYEDLYFYNIKNISLKKGERGNYELFTATMPMAHIYELALPTNATSSGYYVSKYNRPANNINKVWHSLKITNKTKYPWTTGTAMVVKQDKTEIKPISQDMMKYTSVGGDTFIKITVATDIQVTDNDIETSRKRSALIKNSYKYDLVTVNGEINIKNYKNKSVKLELKRSILGKLIKSDYEWNNHKELKNVYYSNINPTNEVSWNVDLKPNEEKKITYTYSVYLNN
jgi:hypothetical protein